MLEQCPPYPQKRTSVECSGMSALCQKQTRALQQTAAYSITSSASNCIETGTFRPRSAVTASYAKVFD